MNVTQTAPVMGMGPQATPGSALDPLFAQAEAAFPRLPTGLLKAVAEVESGLNPGAMGAPITNPNSPHYGTRAVGLMQIMPSVARRLNINPADPGQAIMGAAKLLDDSLTRWRGDLTEAILDYYGRGTPPSGQPTQSQYVSKVLSALGKYNPQLVAQGTGSQPQLGIYGNKLMVNGRAFDTNAEGIVAAAQHMQASPGAPNPPGTQPLDPRDFAFFYEKATTPDATAGGVLKQTAAGLLRGIGTLPQLPLEGAAMLANKLFGTKFSGMNPLEPVARMLEDSQTLGTQAARRTPVLTGNLLTGDWSVNPNATMSSVGMQLADGIGSVLSFLGGARAAQYIGSKALAALLTKPKPLGMGTTGAITGFAQTAGGAMTDIERELGSKTHDQLMKESPAYAELISSGASPDDARFAIIEAAKRYGGTLSGIGGAAGGAVGGALAGRVFGGAGLPGVSGIKPTLLRTGTGGVLGVLGEGAQETIEQIGQNVGQGLAMGQPVTAELAGRDTAPAAFGGALTGGVVGGAFSVPRGAAVGRGVQQPPPRQGGQSAIALLPPPPPPPPPQVGGVQLDMFAPQQLDMFGYRPGDIRPPAGESVVQDTNSPMPEQLDMFAPQQLEFPPAPADYYLVSDTLAKGIKNPAARHAMVERIREAERGGQAALEKLLDEVDEAVAKKRIPLQYFDAVHEAVTDVMRRGFELAPAPEGDMVEESPKDRQVRLAKQLAKENPQLASALRKKRPAVEGAEKPARPTQPYLVYERAGRPIRTAGDIADTVIRNMVKHGAVVLDLDQGPSPLYASWYRTIRSRLVENAPVMVNAKKLRRMINEVRRTHGPNGAPLIAAIEDTIDQITDVAEPGTTSILWQIAQKRQRNPMFKRKESNRGQEVQAQEVAPETAPETAPVGAGNAIQEQSTTPVDVRQQAGNGPPVGGGDAQRGAAAGTPKAKAIAQARKGGEAVGKEATAPTKKPSLRSESNSPQQRGRQDEQQKASREARPKKVDPSVTEYWADKLSRVLNADGTLDLLRSMDMVLSSKNDKDIKAALFAIASTAKDSQTVQGRVAAEFIEQQRNDFPEYVKSAIARADRVEMYNKTRDDASAVRQKIKDIDAEVNELNERLHAAEDAGDEAEQKRLLKKISVLRNRGMRLIEDYARMTHTRPDVLDRMQYMLSTDESASARPLRALLTGIPDVKTALEKLLESKLLTSDQSELVRQLLKTRAADATIQLLEANHAPSYHKQPFAVGMYDGNTHVVMLYRFAGVPEFLHEVVHAAVYRFMVLNPNDSRVKELQALYDKTMETLTQEERTHGHYGLKDVHEFVAEAFTNRSFQHLLSLRRVNRAATTSLWDKFVRIVRAVIGLPANRTTVLDEVLRLGAEVAQLPAAPVSSVVYTTAQRVLGRLNEATMRMPSLGAFKNLPDHARKALLGFSSTFNIEELFGERFKAISKYSAARSSYEAIVSRLRDNSNSILEEFDGWLSGNKEAEKTFSIVMNESSRLGVMPDEQVIEQAIKDAGKNELRARDLKELLKSLKKMDSRSRGLMLRMASASKDTYGKIIGTLLKFTTEGTEFAAAFPKDFDPQTATFDSVSEIMDKLFDMIGKETEQSKQIKVRIRELRKQIRTNNDPQLLVQLQEAEQEYEQAKDHREETEEFKKVASSIRQVRTEYRARRNSLYAHLGRAGDFFISFNVVDSDEARKAVAELFEDSGKGGTANAKRVFSRFETWDTWSHWRKEVKKLADAGHITDFTAGRLEQSLHQFDNTQPEFIRRLVNQISSMSEDTNDDKEAKARLIHMVRTLAIDILPETSPRRALAKRMGTPGYDQDVRRNWSKRMESMISSLASISTAKLYDNAFSAMREELDKLEDSNPEEQAVLQQVMNELKTRRMLQLEPMEDTGLGRATQLWKALGNTFFLAMSPAYIVTNLMQPTHLTLPILASEYGLAKATKALLDATRKAWSVVGAIVRENYMVDGLKGVFDARVAIDRISTLDKETKDVINAFIDSGQLEATFNMEMARAAKGHTGYSVDSVLNALSSFGHYSEVINRLAAGLAAYELSKDYDEAVRIIKMTQYDYSAGNVARYFGRHGILGAFTPVALSFQQYSFQTLELLARLALHSLKGDKAARKAFLGILGTTATLAGALGLPLVTAIAAAIDAVAGDDDEPYDSKAAVRAWMAEVFGKEAGEVLSRGLPRAFGVDLSSRSGLHDLLPFSRFLADKRALDERLKEGGLSLLGPSVGAVYNMAQGASLIARGNIMDGLIRGTPLAVSGPLKAYKLANVGYTSQTGVQLPMEPTVWDVFYQSLGFNPAAKAEQSEANFVVKAKMNRLRDRASELRERAYRAFESGDIDEQRKVLEDIVEFSRKNPDFGIRDLHRGMRSRAEQQAVAAATGTGVPVGAKGVQRLKEVSWANSMR